MRTLEGFSEKVVDNRQMRRFNNAGMPSTLQSTDIKRFETLKLFVYTCTCFVHKRAHRLINRQYVYMYTHTRVMYMYMCI